jgi:hypothetical protein
MSFLMISGAFLTALVAHTILLGIVEFLAGKWLQKKQARLVAEFQQKIDSGELNPLDFVNGMPGMGGPGFPSFPEGQPQSAVSGTLDAHEPHGQYL